jgi:hypothetical protein
MHAPRILLLALLPACTVDVEDGLRPLEPEEVDHITPGDATGRGRGGLFTFTDIATNECTCREGEEDEFGCDTFVLGAEGLWVEQDDGVAEITAWPLALDPFTLRGGMWATGHVLAGGVESTSLGVLIHRVSGTIEAERNLTASWQTRAQLRFGGETYDCDLLVDFDAQYVAPEEGQECVFDEDCHPAQPRCVDKTCVP